jgi:hypothetical protein
MIPLAGKLNRFTGCSYWKCFGYFLLFANTLVFALGILALLNQNPLPLKIDEMKRNAFIGSKLNSL